VNSSLAVLAESTTLSCGRVDAGRGLSRRALSRTLDLIERCLGEHLTLADLAAAAAVSRFHFARMFRVSTGRSPKEYLLLARIERSKQLLAQDCGNIAATAAALGFCDQSHFARRFKRLTGMSPRDFASLTRGAGRTAMTRRPALNDTGCTDGRRQRAAAL
jgi:AraC family transcriptional regulator